MGYLILSSTPGSIPYYLVLKTIYEQSGLDQVQSVQVRNPSPTNTVFLRLVMSRIHDCLEEFNVSMYPAAILRRACSHTQCNENILSL